MLDKRGYYFLNPGNQTISATTCGIYIFNNAIIGMAIEMKDESMFNKTVVIEGYVFLPYG